MTNISATIDNKLTVRLMLPYWILNALNLNLHNSYAVRKGAFHHIYDVKLSCVLLDNRKSPISYCIEQIKEKFFLFLTIILKRFEMGARFL